MSFEYVKPKTLDEAVSLLTEYGDAARILAGGTDLALKIKEGTDTPAVVVDIKGLDELKKLEVNGNGLTLGALVTFSKVFGSELVRERCSLLGDASGTVGAVGIRNRATLAGNICSAVPSLDSAPALLVHEAIVQVKSSFGDRTVPIAEWFAGPKRCALQSGEIVTGLSVPLPPKKAAGCYVKLGRYSGEDLAQAGVGVLALEGNDYRIAFCALGPVAKRAPKIEAYLQEKELCDEVIQGAKDLVPEEISPITDIRSTKEYRLLTAKVMLERGLQTAAARLRGEDGTPHGAIWV